MTDHNHIPGECPEQEENPRQRVSLQGKYCLSSDFLKVALPFYVIFLVGLSFGRDIFGPGFSEFHRGLCFGALMLFAGIFLAQHFRIWERVPEKSSDTTKNLSKKGSHDPTDPEFTRKD